MTKVEIIPAGYHKQVVPDYKNNPLIDALPAIWSDFEAMKILTVDPVYHRNERELDAQYRVHCVKRLFSYFQPLDTHIDIDQRISCAIRQGYIGKSPLDTGYAKRLVEGYEAIGKRDVYAQTPYRKRNTASGFTIIGMSGVGKTTAIERILSLYPQCIEHTVYNNRPLFLTQLVWLKIDCPFDGSLKGLCLSFFAEFDRALGTDYAKKFLHERMTIDAMLPRMTQIANTHCLGLLVVDEIQHLSQAKSGGSEKMLNFFVTLVNTIGVPVVLIGTTKALSVLQSEFRQARRGSGQGDLIWSRMKNDLSWETLLQAMWKYQWTRKSTPLTGELKDAIYSESQGIIDIAVKLYAMAQVKAITTGTERVTPKAIREVAAEKLRLVRPMLDALRSGDIKKIARYEDIRPIDVEDYFTAQMNKLIPSGPYEHTQPKSLEEQAVIKLLEMDIPSKQALSCVRKVIKQSASAQPLSNVVKKAFKLALSMDDNVPPIKTEEQDGDLRNLLAGDVYNNMRKAGVVADASENL